MNPAAPGETFTTGTTTWVQISFTLDYLQPTVPPSPASGSIGMGSLTGTIGRVRETGVDGVKKPGVLGNGAGRRCGLGEGIWLVLVVGLCLWMW